MEKQILLDYSGDFRFETIEILLQKVKEQLSHLEVKTGIKKKVVNIMVECLENIYKYTTLDKENSYFNRNFKSKVILKKENKSFIITAGNTILNNNIEPLKEKIDHINNLDKDGLQNLYESIINNGHISDKGGAGLGIVDIALRSGNKLNYDFSPIDHDLSFYELKIKINLL
ncbi:MAG: hypothetical protein HY958_07990 [Bacteroidia bacterium]|nr:hypothetical protein [Bacteroidia bacterium]